MEVFDQVDFVVIGATGWLGQATLEYLFRQLAPADRARVHAFASTARSLTLRDGTTIQVQALSSLPALRTAQPALVFHYAFQTKDRVGAMSHEEYILLNCSIREALLQFVDANPIAGLFVPSSGAAYAGLIQADQSDGAIYGRCKLDDERAFEAIGQRYQFPVVSPRVFNVSGPYINKHNLYALASIISACLSSETISVRATHQVIRSYYSVTDLIELCCRLIFAERDKGAVFHVFDTVGTEIVEVGELALRCQALLAPHLAIERPPLREAPADRYVGDATAIRAFERRLQITPLGLDQQIKLTADYMSSLVESDRL
ncbi:MULTISPECIES: NAD(P)-dependent oxidoreductase [unclassified Pseudomonas]|uniref:NAD-dependent epimerase/dehydratase family protein n=1 Tax=unclassified Pseudomonas TaxID=196821 RepID=UPI0020983047|nr:MULTISPECIES: NAD(P)-dependent oxidoreductase [unclassified Pseudomonas]MCO7519626.1 NAD(P)-dependent oxidoreductase [Pseudomonas sp. 1]MCO7538934.1 NAD(P)-dependent oxidoreductase [Pseudomonas sp. VA159-2]